MFTFIASIVLSVSFQTSAPKCETVGPRIDGVSVLVCDGRVKSMTDASGNTVEYPAAR